MLTKIGDGLWYGAADVRFYGAKIQTRMSVVQLTNGALAIISPLILTEQMAAELAAIGPVEHVLSPNKIHNQGLESFAKAFPNAQIWASPGLEERRPDLKFVGTLGDVAHDEWGDFMDQLTTKGNVFFSEVVFFHKASKTLIVADLVENISDETVKGSMSKMAAKAGHIFGRALPSPEFRIYTTDATAAATQLDKMCEWPFERILMAHGDIIEEQAQDTLRDVRNFLVAEVSARPDHRAAIYRYLASKQ